MNIDEIMDMLDWNNSVNIQEHGRYLAKDIKCINVFLQPGHLEHNKNVWSNCAMILAEKSNEELSPYLFQLLEWLQDMNWPGAECILARLKKFNYREYDFDFAIESCIKKAKCLEDELWLAALLELKNTIMTS